jgi:Tripartite tricarboxylate transporter TctB family
MMVRGIERIVFTSFIALVILVALLVSTDWPIRASIIILLLGGIGVVLALVQLVLDLKNLHADDYKDERPAFETVAIEHQGRWGTLEIWAWLVGLFLAIQLIGFPIALPLFVSLYVKLYGGSWPTAVLLAAGTWGFLVGVFDEILSVHWPEPWVGRILAR